MSIFEILDDLAAARRLSFLIIGGHAVNAYGYSRFTKDLDILINKSDRPMWLAALAEKGFALYHDGGGFLQMASPSGCQSPLDLMLVSPTTFAKMDADTKSIEIGGKTMRVPSLENLLALKFHVLQQEIPGRGFKDLMDILSLAESNAVDLRSDKFRALCEKYGSGKIYERILAFKG